MPSWRSPPAGAVITLSAGPGGQLVADLQELALAHPLDERLAGLYLRALTADGRPAEALAAFEDLRRGLAETLGTDPSPALRDLHTAILRGLPEPTGSTAALPTPTTETTAPASPSARHSCLPHARHQHHLPHQPPRTGDQLRRAGAGPNAGAGSCSRTRGWSRLSAPAGWARRGSPPKSRPAGGPRTESGWPSSPGSRTRPRFPRPSAPRSACGPSRRSWLRNSPGGSC